MDRIASHRVGRNWTRPKGLERRRDLWSGNSFRSTLAVVDRRCDIYAASVVLWELATGQRLFSGESHAEIIARVLSSRIPAPSSIASRVDDALEEVILNGLDASPDRRYATAREMDHALKRAVPVASTFEVAEWLAKTIQTPSVSVPKNFYGSNAIES